MELRQAHRLVRQRVGLLQQDAGPDPSHGQGSQGLRKKQTQKTPRFSGSFFVLKVEKAFPLPALYDIIGQGDKAKEA